MCKEDEDIESFLHNRAIEFEKISKARTYLIVDADKLMAEDSEFVICGYVANSHFLRTAGPHFPDSSGHIKRTAWEISRAEGTPPY